MGLGLYCMFFYLFCRALLGHLLLESHCVEPRVEVLLKLEYLSNSHHRVVCVDPLLSQVVPCVSFARSLLMKKVRSEYAPLKHGSLKKAQALSYIQNFIPYSS